MSGNCDEEREEAHTEAPVYVSPGGRGIYLRHEKRKYERSDFPKKRANQSRVGEPTRVTSGKHKFAARLTEKRQTRLYARLVRTWSSIPSLADISGRGPVRRGWLQVARSCRDEILCLGTGDASGTLPFLIISEDSRTPDSGGGVRVVFPCRSHASEGNYRCRAAWQFRVLKTSADFFDVAVFEPATNANGEIETDE